MIKKKRKSQAQPLNCPCGSGKSFTECCEKFLSGVKQPQHAEELMRSRYSAFVMLDLNYIASTMKGIALQRFNCEASKLWAEQAKWRRLKVINSYPHKDINNHYLVEFKAYYIWRGKPQILHELSEFAYVDGSWFYIDGHSLS